MSLPLIFSHYGNADYLERTLRCAQITNPHMRRILIGDESNRVTAEQFGWEHVLLRECQSDLRQQFGLVFRRIQGSQHSHMRGSQDWLRFVFERWYIILSHCELSGIEAFWHFDSDVMVLERLSLFERHLLSRVDFTRQCNDTCLNGLVTLKVLRNFCIFTLELFKNEDFLAEQQAEFDTLHPDWAFSEMRAFNLYSRGAACKERGLHLESAVANWWFDDCVCQMDGFETELLPDRITRVKRVTALGGRLYGTRHGSRRQFATLNLSWVPIQMFDWVLGELRHREIQSEIEGENGVSLPSNGH